MFGDGIKYKCRLCWRFIIGVSDRQQICFWNICKKTPEKTFKKALQNICNIHIKTLATYVWNICNTQNKHDICVKHMQHPKQTHLQHAYENRWNIWNTRLQHACITIITYATSRTTFATSMWNTCNTPMKHLNTWNIQLQHALFYAMSPCCLDKWRISLRSSTLARRSVAVHGAHRCPSEGTVPP